MREANSRGTRLKAFRSAGSPRVRGAERGMSPPIEEKSGPLPCAVVAGIGTEMRPVPSSGGRVLR